MHIAQCEIILRLGKDERMSAFIPMFSFHIYDLIRLMQIIRRKYREPVEFLNEINFGNLKVKARDAIS
ncbi:hypothetical protein DCMF_19830 [Candidatus Formimonas warabiya]|uniref:Uncharacterized protein n=1 Tax=Formimonas warabiya TaxID=1761012 RepID=A0A3G1KWG6_FORW1|nr:hypothetical protein DCMF_19830 [Candidatus Formimonas warabiya]